LKHPSTIRVRDVQRMQQHAANFEMSHEAQLRLQWIAFHLTHGRNISLTARHFGIARSTFVRWMCRFDPHDPSVLEDHARSPLKVRVPETSGEAVALIEKYRRKEPMISKERICGRLWSEHHIILSSATVGREIRRHGFYFAQTPSHRGKRRAALQRGVPRSFGVCEDPENASLPDITGESFSFSPQLNI